MFTLDDLLDIAVKMEENGAAIYKEAARHASDPALKELLTWMADEEIAHGQWFMAQKGASAPSHPQDGMLPEILHEMMGDRSLSLDDVDFSSIASPQALLAVFTEFETDTLLFYDFLEAFLEDPQALASLEKIKAEEKAHIKKLQEIAKGYSPGSFPKSK